jgi:hypothetical protein
MTKLTLSMDEAVVAKAKRIARANRTSVSAMVTQFVVSLGDGSRRHIRLGPLTRKASGLVRLPAGKDYKELIEEAICDRHGGRK